MSIILRRKKYAKLQKANFFFLTRYFIYKSYYLIRQYFIFYLLHLYPKMRMNVSSIVKKRYQNFIIIPEANNKVYKTAILYVFKMLYFR